MKLTEVNQDFYFFGCIDIINSNFITKYSKSFINNQTVLETFVKNNNLLFLKIYENNIQDLIEKSGDVGFEVEIVKFRKEKNTYQGVEKGYSLFLDLKFIDEKEKINSINSNHEEKNNQMQPLNNDNEEKIQADDNKFKRKIVIFIGIVIIIGVVVGAGVGILKKKKVSKKIDSRKIL